MSDLSWTNVTVKLSDLIPWGNNPKTSTGKNAQQLQTSRDELGQFQTVAIEPTDKPGVYQVADGHQRLSAWLAKYGKAAEIDARLASRPLTETERRKIAIYSRQIGAWDWDVLSGWEPDELTGWGFDVDLLNDWRRDVAALGSFLESEEEQAQGDAEAARRTLAERFVVPPFSVLDARQGYWQDRKRAWLALGLKGEIGRMAQSNALPETFNNSTQANQDDTRLDLDNGTSIFDPVLCELAYIWFTPLGAAIFDPFAGGSVRGIIAAHLGRRYTGIDLRAEQIAANEAQGREIVPDNKPIWLVGDSLQMGELLTPNVMFDFIFSCPPYADLEVYSDNPQDISTMSYPDFLTAYREIIRLAVSHLNDNRFACFVVGDVRDKHGNYYNFVGDTVQAFKDVGCRYYNEGILVTPLGTVMMQASRNFPIGRKLGKTHQNVLVFVKGDGKKAAQWCGPVETLEMASDDQ